MAVDTADKPKSASSGLLSRVIGILTAPRQTYQGIVANPRWLDVMALVILVSAAGSYWFLSTDVGQQALFDQQVQQAESWGSKMSERQLEQMEQMLPYSQYFALGGILIAAPIFTFLVAGILYAIFNAGLGGEATYKQVLAVVAHAGVVTIVQQIFTLPLNYIRESMTSPTNLAVFFPMLDENGFLARALGVIDLFFIWWIFVLAIGLAVLYRRRTQPIAITLFVVYGLIAVIVGLVRGAFGGGS
jgi:hypothetical protein